MKQCIVCLAALALLLGGVGQTRAGVIDFATLGGSTGDPYASYTEAGFTATATGGSWFVSQSFGNPIPSIFAGPVGNPSASELSVTKSGGGSFAFASADFSSNNGISTYEYKGFLLGNPVFDQVGTLPASGPVFAFTTIANSTPGVLVDTVRIDVTPSPTGAVSSINVDNIVLNATPEPGTLTLLGIGIAGMTGYGWRRRQHQARA